MRPQAAIRNTEMNSTTDILSSVTKKSWRPERPPQAGGLPHCAFSASSLVDGCGDDNAYADAHRADEHGQREVFILDDLLPQVIGRDPIVDGERDYEEHHSVVPGKASHA